MAALAEQLVGRTAELASLDQALDELQRGRSGALELVGEPGIGKTRLLAELAARADERGQLGPDRQGVGAGGRPAVLGLRRRAR
jgi:MoxR-like ATPase